MFVAICLVLGLAVGSLIANLLLLYYDEEIYNLIDHMIEKVEGIF